ncbi:MAG: alpha/beta hydrolase [Drouetiella hepatica Uher 2000/2452]|jgi:pimeloyl-ACP methyl ester carboxylesterase|uniref:Alpha/beta hydrolase n=1 Tax=Drouetiella hepatica Uher 2000/2452 TaxID=904376 RepID=A0A951UMK3_9CYAN|nr:alpha/beta hydrolase [Drouetiella hepatica Uher 2000/2452]
MLSFQPPGFGQRIFQTSLGVIVYYTPIASPLRDPDFQEPGKASDLPPLLFLHSLGGGSSAYEWSKVYPAFASEYRVIAPDLIGWGQSTHPVKDYQVEDYLLLLTELLEQINPPVPVVASSLTAGLTIRLAIQRPDLFQSLFLVAPSGYGDFGLDYGQGVAAKLAGIPLLDRLIYSLGAANEFAIRNFLEQFLFAQRSRLTPEIVAAYLASATQLNAEYAALASLRGDLCFDLSLYLDQLNVPTVLVWGEQAQFSKVELGKRLAKLNPKAIEEFWSIAQAGVLPHLETPEIVTGLLFKALNKTLNKALKT